MRLRSIIVLVSMACVSSAFGGAGVVQGSVTPLGDANITYSIGSPAMDTYVGYTVALSNDGGNTLNNVSFTVTARATDAAEGVPLFNESQYLPAGCSKTAPNAFTCTVGQLRTHAAFPTFQVFFKAPVKVVNGSADADGSDFINVNMHVLYAERTGARTRSRRIRFGTSMRRRCFWARRTPIASSPACRVRVPRCTAARRASRRPPTTRRCWR